jgi:hypothetical protein
MTLIEQIQDQLRQLPFEKQSEVLDFVSFLQQRRTEMPQSKKPRALSKHPAFGSWRGRKIDALKYEQALRVEWDFR